MQLAKRKDAWQQVTWTDKWLKRKNLTFQKIFDIIYIQNKGNKNMVPVISNLLVVELFGEFCSPKPILAYRVSCKIYAPRWTMRIPSHRELGPVVFWRKRNCPWRRIPHQGIRAADASPQHYGPTIRPVGECANIIACKDIVLPLPQ